MKVSWSTKNIECEKLLIFVLDMRNYDYNFFYFHNIKKLIYEGDRNQLLMTSGLKLIIKLFGDLETADNALNDYETKNIHLKWHEPLNENFVKVKTRSMNPKNKGFFDITKD